MEKRADVDTILNQIIELNDCANINEDFLLNYMLEHNVIVKQKYNNIEPYSLNENASRPDLIKILSSSTPDVAIPNA